MLHSLLLLLLAASEGSAVRGSSFQLSLGFNILDRHNDQPECRAQGRAGLELSSSDCLLLLLLLIVVV